VSKAAITKEIKDLRGIVANALERAQVIAVAVIMHDAEHNDCTLSVDLVNSLPNAEQKRWMTAFLRYFGEIGVEMKQGRATNAKHVDPRGKNYRPRNVDGAKANLWFEPEQGDWYTGPPRDEFVPGTIGVVGDNVVRFGERLADQLSGKALKTLPNGDKVPFYALNDEQREVANQVVIGLKRLGSLLSATENAEELRRELAKQEALINDSTSILETVTKDEDTTETDAPEQEAVAG
jgi:hypothetical protein